MIPLPYVPYPVPLKAKQIMDEVEVELAGILDGTSRPVATPRQGAIRSAAVTIKYIMEHLSD